MTCFKVKTTNLYVKDFRTLQSMHPIFLKEPFQKTQFSAEDLTAIMI